MTEFAVSDSLPELRVTPDSGLTKRYAEASGDMNPIPHRRGLRQEGRPARLHPARPVDDGPGRARPLGGSRRRPARAEAPRSSSAGWASRREIVVTSTVTAVEDGRIITETVATQNGNRMSTASAPPPSSNAAGSRIRGVQRRSTNADSGSCSSSRYLRTGKPVGSGDRRARGRRVERIHRPQRARGARARRLPDPPTRPRAGFRPTGATVLRRLSPGDGAHSPGSDASTQELDLTRVREEVEDVRETTQALSQMTDLLAVAGAAAGRGGSIRSRCCRCNRTSRWWSR